MRTDRRTAMTKPIVAFRNFTNAPKIATFAPVCVELELRLYRVIHKSLRDFRPLRYSSQDGHAEGEHVNRGRDTSSFCPTLQVLDMLTSEGS